MIIIGSILTTFESSSIFGGSWGSIENLLESNHHREISLPKSMKRSVEHKILSLSYITIRKITTLQHQQLKDSASMSLGMQI
jgi:hypothetical protein